MCVYFLSQVEFSWFFLGGGVVFFVFLLKEDVFYRHLVMNMAKRRIYLNKLCMGKRGHF